MVDKINFNEPAIEKITFEEPKGLYNADYEYQMQQLAGLSPSSDFAGVRDSLAQQQIDEAREWDMQLAAYGLEQGTIDTQTAANIVNYNYLPDPSHSLEKAVARRQVEAGLSANPDQADIEYTDADGMTEAMAQKAAMLQKFYKDLHEYSDNSQGMALDTLDFVGSALVPGNAQYAQMSKYSKTLTGDEVKLTHHGLANTLRKNINKNYLDLSPEEFSKWLDTAMAEIISHNPNRIMLDDYIHAVEFGGSVMLDTAAVGDIAQWVAGPVKAIYKGTQKMMQQGFNKTAAKTMARDIVKNSPSAVEKLDTVLESAVKPVSQDMPKTTLKSIASNDISEEVFEIAKRNFDFDNLEPAEADALKDLLRRKTQEEWGLSKNEPLDIVLEQETSGKITATYTLGGSNQAGLSAKQMEKMSKKFEELGVDAKVVQRDGTGNYLQFSQEIDPTETRQFVGLVNNPLQWIPLGETRVGKVLQAPLATLGKIFGGSSNVSDVAHRKDVAGERLYARMLSDFAEWKKAFNSLDKEQKELVEKVATRGNVANVWYTDRALRRFGLSDAGIEAYNSYRKAEDLSYVMKNMVSQRALTQDGQKLYAGKYIGKKVDKKPSTLERASIIDETGAPVKAADIQEKDTLIALNSLNDTDATHLVIRGEVVEEDIPVLHLPYRAGGRREYIDGTQFIRVLGDVVDAEGNIVGKRVRTVAAAQSAKEAERITADINKVIEIVKTHKGNRLEMAAALAEANLQYFKVHSIEQLEELIDKGIITENGLAKYMLDGKDFGVPNAYQADDWSAEMQMLNARFNQHRGNVLEDVLGNQAAFFSIDDMFNKAVRKAAAIGARGDLMLWYKKALGQFAGVIQNWDEIRGMNAVSAIRNAVLVPRSSVGDSERATLYRAAESFINHARGIANTRTAGEEVVQRALDNLAYQFLKQESKTAKKIGTKIAGFSPVALAQRIMFNKAMGWFNPGQLFKQSEGALAAIAIEPTNAPKVLAAIPALLTAAVTKEPEAMKNLAKALGISVEEANGLLKFMKDFGTKESSGMLTGAEHLQMSVLNNTKVGSVTDWVMKNQYAFMRWGNAINYYAADMLAYLAKKNKSHKEIAAYSHDIFINMTRASNSWLQRGLTAPLTQWLSYPMRMAGALFNRRLTGKQTLALGSTLFALYGPSGVAGDSVGEWMYGWDKIEDPKLKSLLSDGLMGLASELTGLDLRSGPKIGNLLEKFYELFAVGDVEINAKSLMAIAGGYDYIKEQAESVYGLVVRVPFTDYEFFDWAYKTAKSPNAASSFKNVARTAIALKTNQLINHKGIMVPDPSVGQIIGQFLGYQPNEAYHQRMIDVLSMKQTELVKEHVDSLDDILTRIEKYALIDVDKYKDDEHYMQLVREFDGQFRALSSALESVAGNGATAVGEFNKAVYKKLYGGIDDLSDEAKRKAISRLPNGIKALILDVMEKDK